MKNTAASPKAPEIGIEIASVNTSLRNIGEWDRNGQYIAHLHIEPKVRPAAQPIRMTHLNLRLKVQEKNPKDHHIHKIDIRTSRFGYTVVVVPKSGGTLTQQRAWMAARFC